LDVGIKIGILLVAVMPTTLSSGIVMTGAAGGSMAHALVITILANGLSTVSIPLTLALLLELVAASADVHIEKAAIMLKLALLVMFPLCLGLLAKALLRRIKATSGFERWNATMQALSQVLILCIVWMAISQSRAAILDGKDVAVLLVLLSILFHGVLLGLAGLSAGLLGVGRGRRESVIFMGGQKTLPLSIVLQVSLFPQYALALAFCVVHHVVHLIMDGYLVGWLKADRDEESG
jgi:sodium/bile acid cotransporter 7